MNTFLDERRFYVYILLDPRSGLLTPFYVGKGCGERKNAHFNPSSIRLGKNPFKNAVISKIRGQGLVAKPFVVKDRLTEDEAFDLEKNLILRFGRRDLQTGVLTNLTDGGEGTSGVSPKRREQLRKQMTGSGSPTFGVGHTDEAKARMSFIVKERISRTGSNRHSEEHKQRLREHNPGSLSLRRKVVQINEQGEITEIYDSVKTAIAASGISPTYMNKLVKPFGVAFGGYIYRYLGYKLATDEITHAFKPKAAPNRVEILRTSSDGASSTFASIKVAQRNNPHLEYHQIWKAIKNCKMLDGCYWIRQ